VREAVDLLRYYAAQCEELFASPARLPGPTGERNELRLVSRGVFVCISPWNFPLAIFTGQIAAALAAGNTAIAKPAEQGSLVGALAVRLLAEGGVPEGALHFLPGDGRALGEALLPDPRVAGVVFTGSVDTAQAINRTLAQRPGALAAFIAETGGINAMIVDSSALPEQVVRDAAQSAFDSAGQRCSALRLLCLQDDTSEHVLRLLRGWMDELVIGDPALLATDVGPVIDTDSCTQLSAYIRSQRVLHQCRLDARHERGLFVPPTVVELARVEDLQREVFGPVLHVVRYRAERLGELVDSINASGYGLTLGVHTRIDAVANAIAARARVGNVYVNRNMIGAQVGVQPFGGMGLSGTGPKAGGPHYLPRFATEQTLTTNTAAVGGNATLLSLAAGTDHDAST
jgi:RHH-type proline utilization regulon transcriptional repressor/proline dehydrogenase/delta 1-pyrroline-5-carboxylate dehydrogenase